MQLKSSRELEKLKEVLMAPTAEGPETAYWVFSGLSHDKWENMTVIAPGRYGTEFPKTYGHYHTTSKVRETYKLVSGEGVFMLQKKHYKDGVWFPEVVDKVFLIKASHGDEIVIVPEEYGHSWSNIGHEPLVTYDDWRNGHEHYDYDAIKDLQGLAYYLVEENGGIKTVPNPKYKDHPEPQWVTAEEFNLMVT
ncbi:hypothetical protein OAL67_00820 [bacterium]|nr:hypothetical protein [bacterium]